MTRNRRQFLVKAGSAMAAGAATHLLDAPNVIAQPKVRWRMSTGWTATLDVLQGAAERLAKIVDEMSGGRFRIEVFPGGQIMQPFECFAAAAKGTIEAFMASPQYWSDREPAIEWFATIPFGMNPQGMAAWYYQGDGLKLMEEAYAAFNLVPRPGMANAPQMAGWFRKKINTTGDFKGLKMRIVNLGGKVYARAGAATVVTPGSEIYAALERGVIDNAEWVGPHYDMQIGLHQTARYYYYPGWHEPGTTLDFGFNKKAYVALPADLQRMLDHAAAAVHVYSLAEHHTKNAIALERLRTEFKGKSEVLPLPTPVLRDLKKLAAEVVKEESEKTPMVRKVHASFTKFQTLVGPWDRVAEGAYQQLVAAAS
jgi:TRAP-type mannitol/chloroaromatic compound transport system substrate-binding protein